MKVGTDSTLPTSVAIWVQNVTKIVRRDRVVLWNQMVEMAIIAELPTILTLVSGQDSNFQANYARAWHSLCFEKQHTELV